MAAWAGVLMVTVKCGAHSKDVPGSRRLVEMTLKRNWSLSHEVSTTRKWTFISVSFKDFREQLPPGLSFSLWGRVGTMSSPWQRLAIEWPQRRAGQSSPPALCHFGGPFYSHRFWDRMFSYKDIWIRLLKSQLPSWFPRKPCHEWPRVYSHSALPLFWFKVFQHTSAHTHAHTHTHTQRERERERESYTHTLIYTILPHSYLSQTYSYTHTVISHIHTQFHTYSYHTHTYS